jgi:hypothetical protein
MPPPPVLRSRPALFDIYGHTDANPFPDKADPDGPRRTPGRRAIGRVSFDGGPLLDPGQRGQRSGITLERRLPGLGSKARVRIQLLTEAGHGRRGLFQVRAVAGFCGSRRMLWRERASALADTQRSPGGLCGQPDTARSAVGNLRKGEDKLFFRGTCRAIRRQPRSCS